MGQNKYVKLLKSDGPHHKNSEFVGSWYRIIGGNRDEWHLCNGAGNTLYARRDHCSEAQNDEDFWADPRELEEENTYLKESVLKSVDLVSSYKLAMTEMQKFINEVRKESLKQLLGENETSELDELEEEAEDYYKLMRKKNTIH